MKTMILAGIGVALGAAGLVYSGQETPAASPPQQGKKPGGPGMDDEIRQQSAWRLFFGDDFDIFIGEPPRPEGPVGVPLVPGKPGGPYKGIANELEFIEHLWSENDRVDEYKALAKRPYLSEDDQILFVNSAYSSLDFDRNIVEVLVALIVNPSFSEGGRDAILAGMNAGKIWDSNRRKKVFEVLESRGEPLPSPKNPQRWIGYHFARFHKALQDMAGKQIEFERRLVELEKRTHDLAEFDRRILILEKRPVPPMGDFSGFDKRLGALEKRNLQPEEFAKRISVLESRIQAPVELEKRIAVLEKAVQTRVQPPAPGQPAPVGDLQKQVMALEEKIKQLEEELKKQMPRPRPGPADRTPTR